MTHRVSFVVMQTTKATQPRQLAALVTCFTILEFGNERFAIHLSGSLRNLTLPSSSLGLKSNVVAGDPCRQTNPASYRRRLKLLANSAGGDSPGASTKLGPAKARPPRPVGAAPTAPSLPLRLDGLRRGLASYSILRQSLVSQLLIALNLEVLEALALR
jgi:hypothetical protein